VRVRSSGMRGSAKSRNAIYFQFGAVAPIPSRLYGPQKSATPVHDAPESSPEPDQVVGRLRPMDDVVESLAP